MAAVVIYARYSPPRRCSRRRQRLHRIRSSPKSGALRTDLNQRLEATMRKQLLVARLQLQEQRTSTVAGQLRDIEARLRENDAGRQQLAASLKMLGMENATEAEKKDNPFFAVVTGTTEQFASAEAALKQQQLDLMRQVHNASVTGRR